MVGPNKPVPVKTNARTVGVSPVGASAYDALQPFDEMPEYVNYKAGGCSSCSGRSASAKAPLPVPVAMIVQAVIDTAGTAPAVLAQRDAAVLKTSSRETRASGVATMPDAFINASALTMAGSQAMTSKIVPFNPYHRGSSALHQSPKFEGWVAEATAWLNGDTETDAPVDVPTNAAEVIGFLDDNPDRVDEVEQIELARSNARVTVKDKIVQVRAGQN